MMKWQPTTILRFVRGFPSSACTALVETDAGKGYVKALGAPEGPHTLASEWVATQLAAWFGLPTFDNAIIEVTDLDEIPFYKGGHQIGRATPGPAFISRREAGEPGVVTRRSSNCSRIRTTSTDLSLLTRGR